jgi:hypothetical protein
MRTPGARLYLVPVNIDELTELRRRHGTQSDCLMKGVLSASSLSRIERGQRITKKVAEAWRQRIAPDRPLNTLFKFASQHNERLRLTWEQLSRAAARVGAYVFGEFKPHFVITFAGPSALFTSLVMAKSLTREQFLQMPVYTGAFRDKRLHLADAETKGYGIFDSQRFSVRMPEDIYKWEDRRNKRIAIIDDTVTTGSVMEELKNHLVKHGYNRKKIKYVTCVVSQQAWSDLRTRPDYKIHMARGSYRMPWGTPL